MSTDRADAPLLSIRDLHVRYRTRRQVVTAVDGLSLDIHAGETVALVGESGSGKSTTAHAVVRLLPVAAEVTEGTILFEGRDLRGASRRELERVRGARIGLIPQDPSVSLNPVTRIGDQVAEVLRIHGLADARSARYRALDALADAGLDNPDLRARQYPHELSGGLRQRVLIAIATVARPALVIADEPTSALDVTVQKQILDHIEALTADADTGVLLVTHDLGVAADRAARIAVMSEGRIVEIGTPEQILTDPHHPYTRSLIAAAPSLQTATPTLISLHSAVGPASGEAAPPEVGAGAGSDHADVVVRAQGLVKDFSVPRAVEPSGVFRAVDDVSLTIRRGRTLALVGESGSGKSTTARLILRLLEPDDGTISFDGADITHLRGSALRALRHRLQVVQQNPYASLNPRLSVGQLIAEPLHSLRIGTRAERRARAVELLDHVGLPTSFAARRPLELSGGQRQRVAIARALAVNPELVVLDEPVSALDVRVQAQILDLLAGLQVDLGVSYLFISHDLAVVRQVSHTIAVMRHGRVLETGPAAQVLLRPGHAYTRELLAAIPGRDVAPAQ
ncbi:ABC transporter ATP-binding protein [Occultella aeris]|uniref:Glutathione import ATP-binding protein GsiA n=1 Tax=Occultella aeris TaxID=2761496 RepID=A0A7M4DF28_9MICO|nr:ABC transporter ATP-binding protein [Occultella aeris]VZO35521.1 Glutathione import ATP-binding protein GsiA [Occultella aeris]